MPRVHHTTNKYKSIKNITHHTRKVTTITMKLNCFLFMVRLMIPASSAVSSLSKNEDNIVISYGGGEGNRDRERQLLEDHLNSRFLSDVAVHYGGGGNSFSKSNCICGDATTCSFFGWGKGERSFQDPFNSTSVNKMKVEVFGANCRSGSIEVSLNGKVLGTLASLSDRCQCDTCYSSSDIFPINDPPTLYNVGGSNIIKLRPTGRATICVGRVEIDLLPKPQTVQPSPCAGVTCSNAGKCQVASPTTARCKCENTFVPSESGRDCICPDGLDFHANVNRCLPPPTAAPTNSPTKSPTVAPTASPIIETEQVPDCIDDMSGTFALFNVKEKVECSWLTRNDKKTKIRKQNHCGRDEVKNLCQSTCGACTACDDKEGTFTLPNVNKKVACDWLTMNNVKTEARKDAYCTLEKVRNMCKVSCGACASAEWEYPK